MAVATKAVTTQQVYTKILSKFPNNISFSFAYGSGVKQQLTREPSKSNMIDFIYCVDNAQKWHEENLKVNKSHYSGLKYFGSNVITKFQENSGAKVYFNTLVPMEETLIKYGVISTKNLITDLLEWSDLYLAGRLHKPVEIIKETSSSELQTALQLNLQSAVHAALLVLPERFTEYDFYHAICNLSYAGDFRMTFGENKNKVRNIILPQIEGFRNLYKSIIQSMGDYVHFPIMKMKDTITIDIKTVQVNLRDDNNCCQDCSPMAKLHHLSQLPRWPQKALTRFWNRGSFKQDTEDVLRAIAYDPDSNVIVEHCINTIVWNSSVSQSLKGILTAGLLKSLKYSSRKIVKMWK